MCNKEEVKKLYFENKLSCTDIAKAVGISHQAVSKILKQFPEYADEKERRKRENKIKHNRQIAECVKKKRAELGLEQKNEDYIIFARLKELQEQNAVSMSKRRTLSDDALVATCINHYKYDPEREKIVFVEDFGKKPGDLPKSVNVHKVVLNVFREYAQNIESEKWTSTAEEKALSR